MASKEELTSQLFFALSNISHPVEGTFFLFLLALIFRWRWPRAWNNFLKSISAEVDISSSNTDETKLSAPSRQQELAKSNKANKE